MKKTAILFLLVPVVLITCQKLTDPEDLGDTFALTNCTLIDGTGRDPIFNAVVVIQSGRILSAGPMRSVRIPPMTTNIDVYGATVLPGFINAHIHNGYNRGNLEAWAQAGVTTVRDLCGPEAFALRDELASEPTCARLVAAGPMTSVPDGYPEVPWGSGCMLPITSVEEARQQVVRLVNEGADVIKLAVESGESFARTIPTLSPEEAATVVQTAHEYGTVASAHVLVASDLERALDAGADDIAHMIMDYLSDANITRMINDGVYWVPTLELWYRIGHGTISTVVTNLRKFSRAGGLVALGTDYDGYDATFELGMPMVEMEWMLEAGMSPMQVIVAGTKNAAAVCNRQADLGTLETGKIADVLVVNGDPLEDIRALTDVRLVIHDGVIIRDERQTETD
ncbi:MAG: amidohydrolase family protein [Candidatus Zixiibacteriota bacterium]|nr:MAG: amidohydrolase family protein [candidate division Zixibacteria bacterium]